MDSVSEMRKTVAEISLQMQQLEGLALIADSVRRSVRALTVSQYVLMGVLLIHALMVKAFVK